MEQKPKSFKKVQIRGGFSDRNHIKEIGSVIQTNNFSERTRIQLYNGLNIIFEKDKDLINIDNLYISILDNVYCEAIDSFDGYAIINYVERCKRYIKDTFMQDTYDSILSLIEYIINCLSSSINKYHRPPEFDNHGHPIHFDECQYMNRLFEIEFVGYRFVGDQIVAITDKDEINEIEQVLNNSINGCKRHIEKAVGFLADREHKDYKNCIKESISAVESICQVITENNKATLGQALKELKAKGVNMHSALESAFTKLYGYTSDEGGIRHCEGMFESNVTFEEAKFMLVS
ncbi:MAG: hypothetical protein K2I82_05490 [Ruminococcus sp.]|nr:hypothetical protein [Ruminococcus sp.]